MRLKRVLIENFRGVRRLDLGLDQTTVLISENHHGKATLLDALGLCLGVRGSDADTCFREGDCCSLEGGHAERVRIVLTFADHGPDGDLADPGRVPVHLEFSGALPERHIHRRFVDTEGLPLDPQPEPSEIDRFQRAHPVLMLRFARPRHDVPPVAAFDDPGMPDPPSTPNRRGAGDLAATIAHVYQELALQRGPVSEDHLNRGLAAAHRLLEQGESRAGPEAPVHRMLGELRAEVRRWGRPPAADASLDLSGSGSHNLALLLVLGSILEVRGDTAFDQEAWPIIAIEDPEAHLHPILLASTQRVIEALQAQTIVTTNSGELISSVKLSQLRRLVPSEREIDVYGLRKGSLTPKDLRRVAYHIRAKRGGVLFARCWMLVEGESEFWLMNQLADVLGYDLDAEGVRLIEFAQCGVAPLAKLANDLGIPWHLLADGDESGSIYARDAAGFLGGATPGRRISKLGYRDVEHTLWYAGFEDVYRTAARLADRPDGRDPPPGRVIAKAVRKRSKPYLALAVGDAASERGRRSIPRVLRRAIESSVSLAREAAGRSQ
jgi:putative ATP-dependent endonuclease of the OLD family